jgi:U3 small nucleolar RNA-associated protein 6
LFFKAATKALRLHPTVPGLWIYAAVWEFEHNLNVTAARVLMQRGLRMCPKSENLWVEYFRMELTAAQKLKARQIVLGIGHKPRPEALLENGNATEHSGMVEVELDGNVSRDLEIVARKEDAGINLMDEQEASFKIARAIYRSAIAALPNSPGLRQQFLEVIEAIDLEQAGALESEIYSGLRDNFPGDEKSWDWQAHRCLLKVHKQGVDNIKSAHEKAIQVKVASM